eukprot:56765-Amphidinium_carterae.1
MENQHGEVCHAQLSKHSSHEEHDIGMDISLVPEPAEPRRPEATEATEAALSPPQCAPEMKRLSQLTLEH